MNKLGLEKEVSAIRDAINEALNPHSNTKQVISEEIYDLESKIKVL